MAHGGGHDRASPCDPEPSSSHAPPGLYALRESAAGLHDDIAISPKRWPLGRL